MAMAHSGISFLSERDAAILRRMPESKLKSVDIYNGAVIAAYDMLCHAHGAEIGEKIIRLKDQLRSFVEAGAHFDIPPLPFTKSEQDSLEMKKRQAEEEIRRYVTKDSAFSESSKVLKIDFDPLRRLSSDIGHRRARINPEAGLDETAFIRESLPALYEYTQFMESLHLMAARTASPYALLRRVPADRISKEELIAILQEVPPDDAAMAAAKAVKDTLLPDPLQRGSTVFRDRS